MQILILNGSPRRNGTVDRLLQEAHRLIESETDATAETVRIAACSIRPCTGCMRCRNTRRCVLPEDDGHRLSERIAAADLLIVGTPTYWGNMSGSLKLLFDRTVPVFMDESPRGIPRPLQKGKQALIAATCSTPFPFNRIFRQSGGAVRAVGEVLKTAGYRTQNIQIGGTKSGRMNSPEALSPYRKRLEQWLRKRVAFR